MFKFISMISINSARDIKRGWRFESTRRYFFKLTKKNVKRELI